MPKYAHVIDNIVVEVFTPPSGFSINDCFHSDLTWVQCDTPSGVGYGWSATQSNGAWTFSPPPAPPPLPLPFQAAALLARGLTISSTNTPSLNGTYACDDLSRADIVSLETSLNAGRGFPPYGAETLDYPDIAGTRHTFNATDFTNLAAAMRDFVYACKAVAGGLAGALPPDTATIP